MGPTGVFLFQDTVGHMAPWPITSGELTRPGAACLISTIHSCSRSLLIRPRMCGPSRSTRSVLRLDGKKWSVPINWSVAKLTAIGSQKLQFQAGLAIGRTALPAAPMA